MRALAPAPLSLLLLAGCSGDPASEAGPTPSPGAGPHGAHDDGTHLLLPEWQVGDHWTLSSPQGGVFTHAVSGESGDDWVMDTDNPDTAFFDAQGDISFLGKVRKSDLAGSQGTTRVEFLRFPLQSGMSWSTTWDGAPTMIHVGEVADGEADLMAMRADGTTYAEYTYSDKAGYFSRFAFYDPAGTAIGFEWSLQASGASFGGQLVRWTLDELFTASGTIPSTGAAQTTFAVEPGYTDLWVAATIDCTAGALVVAFGPPDGPAHNRGYSANGQCPLVAHDAYSVSAPPQSEQWGYVMTAPPTVTTGTIDLHLYGRTLSQFAVGQAP
jgi:hypothetical protein